MCPLGYVACPGPAFTNEATDRICPHATRQNIVVCIEDPCDPYCSFKTKTVDLKAATYYDHSLGNCKLTKYADSDKMFIGFYEKGPTRGHLSAYTICSPSLHNGIDKTLCPTRNASDIAYNLDSDTHKGRMYNLQQHNNVDYMV